jgi:hypothetical protein
LSHQDIAMMKALALLENFEMVRFLELFETTAGEGEHRAAAAW